MMRCDECRALIEDLLDGELDPRRMARMRDHLAACPACSAERRARERIDAAIRSAVIQPAPRPELWESVRAGLRRQVGSGSPRSLSSVALLPALAALLLVLWRVGLFPFQHGGPGASGAGTPYVMSPSGRVWEMARIAGAPRVSGPLRGAAQGLQPGEVVRTDAASRAELTSRAGALEIGPSTDLQLVATGRDGSRFRMAGGFLVAHLTTPARQFAIETPAGTVVDLGCSFDLQVAASGGVRVVVHSGSVAIERVSERIVIPPGSMAEAWPGMPLRPPVATTE